jgi:adenylate cyclase
MALTNSMPISYHFEKEYEEAISVARTLIADRSDNPWAYRWLAAALGQLGRSEAGDALSRAQKVAPEVFDPFVRQRVPWMRLEDYDHMLDGLPKFQGDYLAVYWCGFRSVDSRG